jgi:hypothetical protein
MRGAAGYLVAAALLTVLGAACLGAWWLEGRIAEAEQAFGTLAFERSQRGLDGLERYLEYVSRLPWIGSGPLSELRARRVAADYWRGEYGSIVPAGGDPTAAIAPDNTALQLVAANAVYRAGMQTAKDREMLLQVIDRSLTAYRSVLRNAPSNEDAAYNYEYLVRLRAQAARSARRQPAPADAASRTSPHGTRGAPPPERQAQPFEILIPQDKGTPDESPDAGRSGALRRRG